MRNPLFPRHAGTAVLAACGLLMAGCAAGPAADRPVALRGEPAAKFNTGRVTLWVTDWGGRPLRHARVDIESAGGNDYYRTAAMSDPWGRVNFNGVPEQVRISVYHAETRGNYSREFLVPSTGITELRMMLETGY